MPFKDKDRDAFYQFIINNNVIGFFETPIKLKSGRESHFYVNWRNIASDVYLIDQLTDFLLNFIENLHLNIDCFIGVPEGATKLGILSQYKWAKRRNDFKKKRYILPMARGKVKKHGASKDKAYLGVPQGNVVILEDVTTTGQSLLELIHKLKKSNIKITAAISLTNRDELRPDGKSVEQVLKKKDIPYYTMSHAVDLLPLVYKKYNIGVSIAKKVENYFKKYGVTPISLLE
jgi:orotate phosphoribosyltransferase